MNSVDETLSQLVSRGYPLELAAQTVHEAQRYMRVARRMPASKIDATSVSPKSQAAVLRALRGVVFTGSSDTVAGAPSLPGPTAACDADPAARRRLAFVAARRLRKPASWLVATAAGVRAAGLAERINALATDFLLDVGIGASTSGEVYFIEAVGAERVKIGVSGDVDKRFGQLAASFPGPLRLLGRAPGGRAREGSLHRRLANFPLRRWPAKQTGRNYETRCTSDDPGRSCHRRRENARE